MIKIIVNADDFGLCRSVNEAVVIAHRKGILTSATIMVNTPGFEEAVVMAGENPDLGIGLHLNIIKGKPVSAPPEVASLLRPDGRFWTSPYIFIRRLVRGRIKLGELEKETRAQIERALQSGLRLTHIDSEKHMHVLPPALKIVLKLAGDYGIRGLRLVNDRCFTFQGLQFLKARIQSLFGLVMKKRIREHGIMTPDRFYGLCRSGRMTSKTLKAVLNRAEEGVSEIMVHPGYMRQELADVEKDLGSSRTSNLRERELMALLDPEMKTIVRRRGIRLMNFGGMGGV